MTSDRKSLITYAGFIHTFSEQCGSISHPFDSKDIPDVWAEVMMNGPASSASPSSTMLTSSTEQASTSSTSTTTIPSSQHDQPTPQPTPAPSAALTPQPDPKPQQSTPPAAPPEPSKNAAQTSNISEPGPAPSTAPHRTNDEGNNTPTTLSTTTTSSHSAHVSSSTSSPAPSAPLATTTIAGAAAGGTVFLALAIGAAMYLMRRRRKTRSKISTAGWDPSGGVHGRPTLPDIGDLRGGNGVYEKPDDEVLPTRYAQPQPKPISTMRRGGDIYHQASTERIKFNNSPYPELEFRSPTIVMANSPSPVSGQEWRVPTREVCEVHAESMGSPVSELEGMSPLVRMGGRGDVRGVELDASGNSRYYAGNGVAKNF